MALNILVRWYVILDNPSLMNTGESNVLQYIPGVIQDSVDQEKNAAFTCPKRLSGQILFGTVHACKCKLWMWRTEGEWSSIENPVREWRLGENQICKSYRLLALSQTHTHMHTHTHRPEGLFNDHYSWQWVQHRKCLVENHRILPLQQKQHPSVIAACMCVCVCVCACMSVCVFLHLSVFFWDTETEGGRILSCHFSNMSLGSPGIALTSLLSFSTCTSPMSTFITRECVCVRQWDAVIENERHASIFYMYQTLCYWTLGQFYSYKVFSFAFSPYPCPFLLFMFSSPTNCAWQHVRLQYLCALIWFHMRTGTFKPFGEDIFVEHKVKLSQTVLMSAPCFYRF